ncbi:MAG: hypothetical protein ACE5FC_01605 [Myxococcota bacterium]
MAACHACGAQYETSERVGFRAVCEGCGADLHVCLNCRFHDPAAHGACRETQAEFVVEKDRSNRCDWFEPGTGSGSGKAGSGGEANGARERLDALFRKPGEAPQERGPEKDPRGAAEDLFRKGK